MQQGQTDELGNLGSKLSTVVACQIRSPAYGKNVFTCKHGVLFSISRLKGNTDWAWAKQLHDKEREHRN